MRLHWLVFATAFVATVQADASPSQDIGDAVLANIQTVLQQAADTVPHAAVLIPGDERMNLMSLTWKIRDMATNLKETSHDLKISAKDPSIQQQDQICGTFSDFTKILGKLLDFLIVKKHYMEEIPGAGNLGMGLYDLNEALERTVESFVARTRRCADGAREAKSVLDEKLLAAMDIYLGSVFGHLKHGP